MRKNFRGPAEGVMFETLLGLFLEKHALNIDVHCDAIPKDLPKHLAVTLFRVLQEALQNV
jgi:signal transduction histidine kinase